MMAAALVLVWVLVVLLIIGAVAYATRKDPVPLPRDSELPSTTPLDGGPPDMLLDTRPGVGHTPWVNTIPSGPVPLDGALEETPWDQAVHTMNGTTPRRRRDDPRTDRHRGPHQADSEGGEA